MAAERRSLKLTEKQNIFYGDVLDRKAPNPGYIGGLGSGKTVAGAAIMLTLIRNYPGIRGLLAAPTYDQLSQGTLQTFLEWCPQDWILSHNRTEHIFQFNFFDDEGRPSEFLYRSTTEIDRIRAHEYAFCWWDEPAMSPEGALQVVRGRLRHRRGLPRRKDGRADWHYPIFMTTTPRGRNWLYRAYSPDRLMNETDAAFTNRIKRFPMTHATTYDNAANLPVSYIDDQEAAMQGDTQLRQQELEGLFVTFEGLVYPQFSERTHVRTLDAPDPVPYDSPEIVARVAGVDFGGGDPSAIVILGMGRSGKVHQFAEKVWDEPVGDVELGGELHKWHSKVPFNQVWCDPSNQTAIATFKSSGLPAGPQVSGPQALSARAINDRVQGLRTVGDFLSREALTINPFCSRSISEFYSYLYRKSTDGEGNEYLTSTPIDHHADCMDARRYALMGLMISRRGGPKKRRRRRHTRVAA